jgi:hypothetical protein
MSIEHKDSSEYTTTDITNRSYLKTQIEDLREEIYDIENDVSEMDYYTKTGDIMMDYYDLVGQNFNDTIDQFNPLGNEDDTINDKLNAQLKEEQLQALKQQQTQSNSETQKHEFMSEMSELDRINMLYNKKRGKRMVAPKKPKRRKCTDGENNIMNFFNGISESASGDTQTKAKTKRRKINRADLNDQYMELTESSYVSDKRYHDPLRRCLECNVDKILMPSEGVIVCEGCGETELIIVESDKPNFKDPTPDKPGYPYKKINHFNEWLSQFQAKESTDIPKEVYDKIYVELNKQRITDLSKLTWSRMRGILRKLRLNAYYEHVPHITSNINGLPPPTITRDMEEKLRLMFKLIQEPFERNCPKGRKNFLSYSYVLHKFCQLLELDDFLKCFPLLKSRDKLILQDRIWRKICRDLEWEFIPSA